jgi:EpsI family protein
MIRYLVTVMLLASAIALNYALPQSEHKTARSNLAEFPVMLDDWHLAAEQVIDDSAINVLRVDDYIMRTYVNPKGESLGLYIGYYKRQTEGKQVHSPRQCLPGAGWNILDHRVFPLSGDYAVGKKSEINYHLMGNNDQQQLYLWWYQGRGRIYANEYLNKLYLMWDSITKRRTDGALVRINMAVAEDANLTLAKEEAFITIYSGITFILS